jgi:ATP-binding protein involved in chromosome partitioning
VIAVASGKGGVGKSTVAVNLALALAAEGHRTGVLDADIYGPSLGTMMGVPADQQPEIKNDMFQPVIAHGLQCMSMSFVSSERTPAVWRGPMASSALQQLLTQTSWQDIEFLIVDMPPGTGDIQLTLAQRVPLSGAVIVTTPQDIALLDARKGIEMFRKVEIPVLGIVENMSTHVCSECGHEEAIFGSGGGRDIAEEYGTHLMAQLPLLMSVREQADGGEPTVVSDPEGDVSKAFKEIAQQIVGSVAGSKTGGPVISIVDD